MSLDQVIKLTYYWVYKLPLAFIAMELKIGSEHTIVDWCQFARDFCIGIIKTDNEQIGGPGIVLDHHRLADVHFKWYLDALITHQLKTVVKSWTPSDPLSGSAHGSDDSKE